MQKLNQFVDQNGDIHDVADGDMQRFSEHAQANGLQVEPLHSFVDDQGNIIQASQSDLGALAVANEAKGRTVQPLRQVVMNDGTIIPVADKDRQKFIKAYRSAPEDSPMGQDRAALHSRVVGEADARQKSMLASVEGKIQKSADAAAPKPSAGVAGAVSDAGRDFVAGVYNQVAHVWPADVAATLKMAGAKEFGTAMQQAASEQGRDDTWAKPKGAGLAGKMAYGAGGIAGGIAPMASPVGWLPMAASVTAAGQNTYDNLIDMGKDPSTARKYAAAQMGVAAVPMLVAARMGLGPEAKALADKALAGLTNEAKQQIGRAALKTMVREAATWTAAGAAQGAAGAELQRMSGEAPDANVALAAVQGGIGSLAGAMGFALPRGWKMRQVGKQAVRENAEAEAGAEARSAATEARRGAEIGPQATAAEIAAERTVAPDGPRRGLVEAIERGQRGDQARADELQAERDLRGESAGAEEGGVSEPYQRQLESDLQAGAEEGALPAGYQREDTEPAPVPRTGAEILDDLRQRRDELVSAGMKPGEAAARAAAETPRTTPHPWYSDRHAREVLEVPEEQAPAPVQAEVPQTEAAAPAPAVRVVSPAIRTPDGRAVTGTDHPSIIAEAMPHLAQADAAAARGEEGVMGGNVDAVRYGPDAGFTVEDAAGNQRWASRAESMEIAKRAGQVRTGFDKQTELHTHMLGSPAEPTAAQRNAAVAARPEAPPADPEHRTLRQRLVSAYQHAADAMSIDAVPGLGRIGGGARDAAAAQASAWNAVQDVVRLKLDKVFPGRTSNKPEDVAFRNRVGDAMVKDNILDGYDQKMRESREAEAKGDKELADKRFREAVDIAQTHDLAQMQADVEAYRSDAEVMRAVEAWNREVNPHLNELYRKVRGFDPGTESDGRGRNLGVRVNLLSKERAERLWRDMTGDERATLPKGVSVGNYRNPNVKRDPFAKRASFTGEYVKDPAMMLAYVLGPRMNEATKIDLYDALVRSGKAQWSEPGEAAPVYDGQKASMMPVDVPVNGVQQKRGLWIRPDLVSEVRTVLNTDTPIKQNAFARALTTVQLFQLTDMMTHAHNLSTAVMRAQGAGGLFQDLARRMPGINFIDSWMRILTLKPTLEERAFASEHGMLRPDFPASKMGPLSASQRVLHDIDTRSRILMMRFYQNLVERGLETHSEDGMRQFVNQIGQYNARLQPFAMRTMKAYGLSPFVVAGRNFNQQGRRWLTGDPGVKGANAAAALQMRMTNMVGLFASVAVVPAILNTLTTGTPMGRPGTPVGAWDMGGEKDKDGKHKALDLLQLSGIRRGMRATGVDAVIEGVRHGEDLNTISGKAMADITRAETHPWVGPALGFVGRVAGVQGDVRGQFAPMKIAEGGTAQTIENARAAFENQNPALYALAQPALREAGIDTKPRDTTAGESFASSLFLRPVSGAIGLKNVRDKASAGVELAARMVYGDNPTGRTQGDLERQQIRKDFLAAAAKGEAPAIPPGLSRQQQKNLVRVASDPQREYARTILNRLSADKVEKVWPQLTDEERTAFQPMMVKKVMAARKTKQNDDLRRVALNIQAWRAPVVAAVE